VQEVVDTEILSHENKHVKEVISLPKGRQCRGSKEFYREEWKSLCHKMTE